MKRYLVLILSPFLLSCGIYPKEPILLTSFPATGQSAQHLIILLAGQGAEKDYFENHDWIAMARAHEVEVDFITPHAHLGYYMTNSLVTRLKEDVIVPAKKKGYKSISIVGISMGGFGAILCSRALADEIDRIYLIAPYLGKDYVHDEIRTAGSLKQWQIKPENREEWTYFIWQHLKEMTEGKQAEDKIFLAYGEQDSNKGIELLARAMPQKNVIHIPGGHKDVIFTQLWKMMLDRGAVR